MNHVMTPLLEIKCIFVLMNELYNALVAAKVSRNNSKKETHNRSANVKE